MPPRFDPKPVDRLTVKKARRIALAAQGFADRRPSAAAITPKHMGKVFDLIL